VSTTNQIRPLRIGLTGGIASGKTSVANLFSELGVPVIDTDIIARQVVEPGKPALDEIRKCFGNAVIDESGNLDRRTMRKLIFSDDNLRLELEHILHPRIGAETRNQSDAANGPYQLIVIPLLVGSPLLQFVDRVLVVDCDEETQIDRLLARDAETRYQARKILSAQASRDDRLAIASDVINNEQGLTETKQQVVLLDQKYRKLASHGST
jgi:dephospho-CoA kinase